MRLFNLVGVVVGPSSSKKFKCFATQFHERLEPVLSFRMGGFTVSLLNVY